MALTAEKQLAKEQKANDANRLPLGRFLAWKSRNVSLAASFIIIGYLSIYCTDALGMPAALVGTLPLASKIFDGITDLFAGYIIDNTHTRLGKARPYEISIIGVWFCTWIMFSVPELGLAGKSVWVIATYTFVQSIFATLLNANQTPYIIRAFGSRETVTKVYSFGGIVTMLGGAAVSISFPMLMARMVTNPGGWRNLIMIYAVPLALIDILRFIFVKECFNMDAASSTERIKLKELLSVLRINPYIWLVGGIFVFLQFVAGMNAGTYYFTCIGGGIARMGTLSSLTIVMMLSMFFFPKLVKRFSVSALVGAGALIGALGSCIDFFAGDRMPLLIAAFMLAGFATMPPSYLTGVMIIDCASYNEWKNKPRLEGTMAAVNNFSGKIGNAFGAGLLGILLGASGYNGTVKVQNDSVLFMIRCLYSLIPMTAYIIMFIFTRLYKLEKLLPQIEKETEERRNVMPQKTGD
ncbi:MAG: MFS transporter [Treponema sp.]|jgi:Na+/melibiose symporter-like transporter|nr:MFS transporter [Treponema sp.]